MNLGLNLTASSQISGVGGASSGPYTASNTIITAFLRRAAYRTPATTSSAIETALAPRNHGRAFVAAATADFSDRLLVS